MAAQLYQENRREYEKRVAAIVEQSWLNFPDDSGDEEGGKKNESSEEGTRIIPSISRKKSKNWIGDHFQIRSRSEIRS